MGNFAKQQEEHKEAKERVGKFFYDLAKIAFTALVVGSIVSVVTEQKKFEHLLLIAIGIFVTFIFSYVGFKIIK